jgi:hypothetical protein
MKFVAEAGLLYWNKPTMATNGYGKGQAKQIWINHGQFKNQSI